jgi:Tfp pilus assembly protein PilO
MFVESLVQKENLIYNIFKTLVMSTSSKAVVSFIVGAAVGVAVGYFLNSDKKDELVEKLRDQSDKLKEKWRKKKDQFQDELENELA